MTELVSDILNYFAIDRHEHCVAEDHGLLCEDIDGDTSDCAGCWFYYFTHGRWWEEEYEPDPDRKWKEMHGE